MLIKRYLVGSEPQNPEVLSRPDWEIVFSPAEARSCRVTTVITFQDEAYCVQQEPDCTLRLTRRTAGWAPLVVLDCTDVTLSAEYARQKLDRFLSFDGDVTTVDLLRTILLNGCSHAESLDGRFLEALGSYGCEVVYTVPLTVPLSEGPYFLNSTGIYRAFRLEADVQEACILSTIAAQRDEGCYMPLAANTGDSHTLAIAVPSRLHHQPSDEKPLSGLRIAVKDLFHLRGVHTGGGNRAYRSLYSAQRTSSHAVELAISKGCVVLGKTKTAELGGSQEVCGDWTDYSYPLNCRADGYLVATGSSTGSAAALAAYEFLDITVGTDAGGSVRDPAASQGIFGLRPSHDAAEEKLSIIPCPRFQRSGYFARDLDLLQKFVHHAVALPGSPSVTRPIRRVAFPSSYWAKDPEVHKICLRFAESLADFMRTKLSFDSFAEIWNQTRPKEIDLSFNEYFKDTFITLLANDYWKAGSAFREDYKAAYGRDPYVCPTTRWLWQFGSSRTEAQLAEATHRLEIHNEWFNRHILQSDDDADDTLIIMPKINPTRRDEYWRPPTERDYTGFDQNMHASFAGLPDLVVPIGQVPFQSSVSGVEERLPVSVSVVASRGQDTELLALIVAFLNADGRPAVVRTGRTAFDM